MSGSFLAAAVALVAAALLGASSVAQRRGMRAGQPAGGQGLLATLVASPWWWAGTIASLGGLALQFVALAIGSLIVVQTTMVSSIVATSLAEWLLLGRRPGRSGWLGIALTATGLIGVLWALAPKTTVPVVPSGTVTAALGGIGALGLGLAVLGARARPGGALALAAATGLGYGITAVALKSVGAQLASGWSAPLGHPALWVAVLLGPTAVLLSQHALQRAGRVAAAVSLIVVIDPVVGLLAGAAWFGEHITTTGGALAVAAASAAALVAGIIASHSGTAASSDAGPRTQAASTRAASAELEGVGR